MSGNVPRLQSARRSIYRQSALAIALLFLLLAALTACEVGESAPIATPTNTAEPSPTAIIEDARICRLISGWEFYGVMDGPYGPIKGSTATVSGFQQVICSFSAGPPDPHGVISYLFTNDGAAYFAQLRHDDQHRYKSENNIPSGVGDDAFWGIQAGSPDAFELNMQTGNIIVNILMQGNAADGSVYLAGAEVIAIEIAAEL